MHKPIKKSLFFPLILLYCFSFSSVYGQDAAAGKQIFESTCTSCHQIGGDLIGPNLTGVKDRWKDESKLISFVQNPQKFVDAGDPYVKGLVAKYNQVMTPQPLTDQQVKDVLAYAHNGGGGGGDETNGENLSAGLAGGTVAPAQSGGFLGMSTMGTILFLLLLFLVLLLLVFVLVRVQRQLSEMAAEKHPEKDTLHPERTGLWHRARTHFEAIEPYINPYFLVMGIIGILVILGVIDMYDRGQDLGSQIGYAPEQPIKFSHKLHAGTYGIQCQYCHTGVEKSKNANIPSINTCMNCHNVVKEGPKYGTKEIAKIYTAIGYNPE
ncbi:MAG: c-type cytochrome, partial [Bacteroidota bacterium]|nr:c-type cytochrome [Bacteroidota bacterium]